jgi:hypothetical protein
MRVGIEKKEGVTTQISRLIDLTVQESHSC